MELELSEDQAFFQETTRKFLTAECPLTTVASARVRPGRLRAATTGAAAPSSGWTSMLVPEADGGGSLSEHGLLDLVLVAEEMGRLVSPGPARAGERGRQRRSSRAGTAEQKAAVLPGLLERRRRWPRGPGPRPVDARRRATSSCSTAWRRPVEAGAQATHLLVVGAHRRRPHAGARARRRARPHRHPAGRASTSCAASPRSRFDDVSPSRRRPWSATVGGAADDVEQQLQIAVVLQCAETVGATDRMFELTLEYLGDRYSFGRPLSSYQALKHRVADDKLWLEACHAIATAAARAVAAGAADAGRSS